jgi:small subunit ribosomal protein S20
MANHKDAVKRAAQSERLRVRNRAFRTHMRNQLKKLRAVIHGTEKGDAQAEFREAVSVIQKLAAKGVIHRNQAARRVARLAAAIRKGGKVPSAAPSKAAATKATEAAPKKPTRRKTTKST